MYVQSGEVLMWALSVQFGDSYSVCHTIVDV